MLLEFLVLEETQEFGVCAIVLHQLIVVIQYYTMGNGQSSTLSTPQKQQLQSIRKSIQNTLLSYKHTLTSITKTVFTFEREEFDTNQLAYLLNKINNNFGFQEAALIMLGLGVEGKIITLQDLDLFLNQNDKKIHPLQKKFEEFRQIVKEEGSMIYLQSLDFDGDNCLELHVMSEVFNLLEFTEVQKEYILGKLFKNKKIVFIPEVLSILRITEEEMNEDSKPCSLMLLSKSKIPQQLGNTLKIPEVLANSLNLNIKVNQELINWLAAVVQSGKRFVDINKPKIKSEHQYAHISQLYPQYFLFEMRTSIVKKDAFRKSQGLLIQAKNIRQGHGKDCYILSALSGVVEIYPDHIYNLFLVDKTNVDVYIVKLFIDGVWDLIICDAEFPINYKKKLVYAQPSKHEIWVLLIEKAWAKVFGSYVNIEEGSNQEGLVAVTGAPCLRFEVNKAEHLGQIQHYLGKGYIASVSTNKLNNMSKQDQKKLGIYANHAYTLLYIFPNVVDALTHQTVTLLYLRNPWGRGTWKGSWSFNYQGWSEQMRKQVNYIKNPKDGSFFIALQDFKKYFSKIKVCCFHPQHVNSSQRIRSNAHKYIANKFTIKQRGDFFLSIYQQNKRKYKNTGHDYKLSNCNIFVAKLRDGRYIEPIGSKAVGNNNLSIQSTFEPGEYICVTRVKWNKQEGEFTLTSYGPQMINFTSITVKDNFFPEFIRLRAEDEIGDKSYYGKLGSPKSYKIVFMSSQQGYGYILICNNEETRSMKGVLSLEAAKGIKMISPLTLKIKVDLKPQTREVYPCMVSPNGYQYKIIEEMILS